MKTNYLIYILIAIVILFRSSLLNMTTNLTKIMFIKDNILAERILIEENKQLQKEYQSLLDFKNNIKWDFDYVITNAVRNNYGFNHLIVNGDNYKIGDEVVNEDGLVGIVTKVNHGTSEVSLLSKIEIVVTVNNINGKTSGIDNDGNLIIKEISNYSDINLNDLVYSMYGTYIGKVIKIKYETIDNYLTVKPVDYDYLNYVGIVSRVS